LCPECFVVYHTPWWLSWTLFSSLNYVCLKVIKGEPSSMQKVVLLLKIEEKSNIYSHFKSFRNFNTKCRLSSNEDKLISLVMIYWDRRYFNSVLVSTP
jgi:hypothetical protein